MAIPQKVAVIGLGESGTQAALLACRQGLVVSAFDRRSAQDLGPRLELLEQAGVKIKLGNYNADDFADQLVVLSPGVDPAKAPLEKAQGWIGEVGFAAEFCQGKMVGITGSNGKSTTTHLAGHLFASQLADVRVGGNLGTPLSALLADGDSPDTFYILELSSYQLQGAGNLSLKAGAFLNLSPDHLARHGSLAAYGDAKALLFSHLNGDAVVNRDDEDVLSRAHSWGGNLLGFGMGMGEPLGFSYMNGSVHWDERGEILFTREELSLPGDHNVANAMAAFGLTLASGLDPLAAAHSLQGYRGLHHRLELVHEKDGLQIFNDSKATNVDAVEKALASFPGGVLVLLGGQDKGGDFARLNALLVSRSIGVMTFGADRDLIAQQIEGVPVHGRFETLQQATREALNNFHGASTILLSPGCASFDQFANFEQRGDAFCKVVSGWQKNGEVA